VVSRKELLEEEQTNKRSLTLEHLEEGAILTGTVKNLTDYGAFVDLGGIDGLLHITDMSWGRLTHPRDLVNVGDEIQVKVLKFDREKQRVSLGFKQLTPDPWLDAVERYPIGARVRGRVLSVTDYGSFVELEQGIEGLVHVSEMTWSKRMKHPSKLVKPGDEVETVVLSVNPNDRRISLGMKQLLENPWEHLSERYPAGTIVEGRVRNLTDFGAFIEIEDGIDGLVHVSNLSWTKRVKHPSEILKKGEKVRAVVLGVEAENRRLSLGIKQLLPDVWETFFAQHRVGDVVKGKVLRTAQFGAFIEIAEGVEGLCHVSEAADANGAPIKLEAGQEHDFKIIKMNQDEKKVGLSLRAGPTSKPTSSRFQAPPLRWAIWSTGSVWNTSRHSKGRHPTPPYGVAFLFRRVNFQIKVELLLAVEGADGSGLGLVSFVFRPELIIHFCAQLSKAVVAIGLSDVGPYFLALLVLQVDHGVGLWLIASILHCALRHPHCLPQALRYASG
jgi:small subunit ribosomal protein S1